MIFNCYAYYKVELVTQVEAETSEEAYQIAKQMDGADFKEISLSDWEIIEVKEAV